MPDLADQFQQFTVQVEVTGGNQVEDRDGYKLLEEGGTLGDEGPTVFRPILTHAQEEP